MPPRKPPGEWLEAQLSALLTLGEGLEVPINGTFVAKPWTLLKLACLRYYVPIYLRILRNRYQRLAFIDLYSAAGASHYLQADSGLTIPGSSVIAAAGFDDGSGTPNRFDELVAIDLSAENLVTLARNVRPWGFEGGKNLFPIQSDSPKMAGAVGEHLSEKGGTHALVFADSDRLEPSFDALRAIVKGHDAVDLVILHLVSGAAMSNSREVLRRFYGCDPTEGFERESLSDLYVRQLERGLRPTVDEHPSTIVEKVRVAGGSGMGGYCYDLDFAWRRTRGDSPFTGTIATLRSKVGQLDGDDVRHVISTIRGSQRKLG